MFIITFREYVSKVISRDLTDLVPTERRMDLTSQQINNAKYVVTVMKV